MADLLEELVELDTTIANAMTAMLPGDPGFAEIQLQASRLSDCITDAQRVAANDATDLFIHGNTILVQTNKKLRADIKSLADLQANIEAITGVIDAATNFLGIFAPA